MSRRRQIYEGKAKILYEGPEPGTIIQYFKDDATAFNAQKKGTINGKGVINNRISEHVFLRLSHIGIPTLAFRIHYREVDGLRLAHVDEGEGGAKLVEYLATEKFV